MSNPTLTLEQIRKIAEEAEGATPGPWKFGDVIGTHRGDGSDWGASGLWATGMKMILGDEDGWDGKFRQPKKEDSDFIASARTNVPALCATAIAQAERIERLEEALGIGATCPVCEEVICDQDCPLEKIRTMQPDEGAGKR